jgi:hypothetical protein
MLYVPASSHLCSCTLRQQQLRRRIAVRDPAESPQQQHALRGSQQLEHLPLLLEELPDCLEELRWVQLERCKASCKKC